MLGLTRAPEIRRDGSTWFNVDGPLSLESLRGRLVILDFWTFCCVNCMHVQPALRRLEEAFPDEVVVVGVHSPKFDAERDPAKVAHAIARYRIRHPVVHDPDMELWQEYCIRAWPTLVLIAPDGYVIGALAGEPDADRLMDGVGEMIRSYRSNGLIRSVAIPFTPVPETTGVLRYPGCIRPMTGADGSRLWAVASSGQHQVVVFDDAGTEQARFGKGEPGFADCGRSSAFRSPQGLLCAGGSIYVADTGNHAIRRIDPATGDVVTLAGTGERGMPIEKGRSRAADTPLASVWDLASAGRQLFFSNAGTHQIGTLDLDRRTVTRLAGNGNEGLSDGPAEDATLAQPSGLALDGPAARLYFVDAETSAVRVVALGGRPQVETLVGAGLFDFGEVDGDFSLARLQHPLGIVVAPGGLLVSDSYNGMLRFVDVAARRVVRLGECEFLSDDGVVLPSGEPAGVAIAGPDRILLADTNNHRILEITPSQRRLRTWAG